MACYFNVSLDYLLLDKGKDEADMQKELLEVIENLFRIAQKMWDLLHIQEQVADDTAL